MGTKGLQKRGKGYNVMVCWRERQQEQATISTGEHKTKDQWGTQIVIREQRQVRGVISRGIIYR